MFRHSNLASSSGIQGCIYTLGGTMITSSVNKMLISLLVNRCHYRRSSWVYKYGSYLHNDHHWWRHLIGVLKRWVTNRNFLTYLQNFLSYLESFLNYLQNFLSYLQSFLSYLQSFLSYLQNCLSQSGIRLSILENFHEYWKIEKGNRVWAEP